MVVVGSVLVGGAVLCCLEPPRWRLCICHPGSRVALDYEQPSVSLKRLCVFIRSRVFSSCKVTNYTTIQAPIPRVLKTASLLSTPVGHRLWARHSFPPIGAETRDRTLPSCDILARPFPLSRLLFRFPHLAE